MERHPSHRQIAREVAQKSVVLLKNDKNDPSAKPYDQVDCRYRYVPSSPRLALAYSAPGINKVSILDGIKSKFGTSAAVRYAKGCSREDVQYVTIPSDALLFVRCRW